MGGLFFAPGTELDARFSARMKSLTNLRMLDVSKCSIPANFFSKLSSPRLEVVYASDSNLSDQHCKSLAKFADLKLVIARDTDTTRLGAQAITAANPEVRVEFWYDDG